MTGAGETAGRSGQIKMLAPPAARAKITTAWRRR